MRSGDWLWANLVVLPADLLNRVTIRGVARLVIQIVLLWVLLMYFEQVAVLHLTMLFTVDASVYLEILTALTLFVVRGHARRAVIATVRVFTDAIRNRLKKLLRFRTRQRHDANAIERNKDAHRPNQDDDETAAIWTGIAPTFA